MAYCKKCGRKVDDESRFCPDCGALIEREELNVSVESENDADDSETRRQVYVGLIRKCPSCGSELTSSAAVCPHCGFELNTRKGAQALQEFSDELNAIEDKIAEEGTKTRGWSTWGTWPRIGWVLLNIYTFCLPIIIPAIFRQIRVLTIKPSPKLTAMEERKAKTIENYIVPNEKGAIIESLRFIRTKVEALNKQSKSEKLMYWMNLWAVKAGQINSIASGSLAGDTDVGHQYNGILKITNGTNRSMRVGSGIKLALLLLVIIIPVSAVTSGIKAVTNSSSSQQKTTENVSEEVPSVNKDNRIANEYREEEIGGIVVQLPDYYGENVGKDNKKGYYAEMGEGTVYLSLTPMEGKVDNETFLMGYDTVLDSFFDGVAKTSKEVSRTNDQTKFKTAGNLTGVLEEYTMTISTEEGKDVTGDGCVAVVNNPDSESIVVIGLIQSKKSQYNYFPSFAEMLKGIKKAE